MGLAEWLFNKKNPLAARVFVNQTWQEFFGKGIVKSSGDFGSQGDLPSHFELLDWLSVDFMDHGWDIKRLVKQLVMSATYRQSAVISADKLKADPDNTLLARGPRYRFPAETVRDMVLASSGLLTRTIGGPSVNPYQPPGLMGKRYFGKGYTGKLTGRYMDQTCTAAVCTHSSNARCHRLKWLFLTPATATSAK